MEKILNHNVFIGMRILEARATAEEIKRLLINHKPNADTLLWLRKLTNDGVAANLASYAPYHDGNYFCPQCAVRYDWLRILRIHNVTGVGDSLLDGPNTTIKLQCTAPKCLKIFT
jgi:hypothetical protein